RRRARRASAGGVSVMSIWARHQALEKNSILLVIGILLVIAIGGIVEVAPLFYLKSTVEKVEGMRPYTPLELAGRNIYVREGCYLCHSQMVRPFRDEVARYGEYSKAGEFVYDHPFQWGSKRTGPDLARVGGKYPDSWHYNHMLDPSSMSPGSIMPSYVWLFDHEIDTVHTYKMIKAMQTLGVPYPDGYADQANKDLTAQARSIRASLKTDKLSIGENKEIVALIAYLQRLGKDIKAAPKNQTAGVGDGRAIMGN
ncbi:MAG TPA: cytochrome-c oxidase, cbb3-type subunit II, partial [Puia sp.]|nr:cytochrome-c oxidase, cbb3-type subunit II [Puia sp.]